MSDLEHDFSKPVYVNLAVLGPYPSGIDPQFIKEPDIRKDYEERRAKNSKLIIERSIQLPIKNLIESVLEDSHKFFIEAYSQSPRADNELLNLLEKYDYPEEEKVKVLKALKVPYQSLHEWQLKDGTKIIAKFISLTGSNVVVEIKDKKRETILFSNLREEDQKYVREQTKEKEKNVREK
jgi:hypothetical protein